MTTAFTGFDPAAINGKFQAPDRHADLVIVGAGAAGTSAAITAAQKGASVLLVDEHPIDQGMMGLDVPYFFGGRMTAGTNRKNHLIEQMLIANPSLEQAFELGVEVELGVSAWGAFMNGPHVASLPGPVIGLADEDRAFMVGFNKLIVAAGARDVVLGFPGWDQPGVMGLLGFQTLIGRYNCFSGHTLVILGSGAGALSAALDATAAGLTVAALVEVADTVQGPQVLADKVRDTGISILTGCVPARAAGGVDGVEALEVLSPATGETRTLACDTIVMAYGLAPSIELLAAMGADTHFDPERGGHVPVTGPGGQTSLENVFAAGDCAGLAGLEPIGDQAAMDQGRAAALAALGETAPASVLSGADGMPGLAQWAQAIAQTAGPDLLVCQCEEVTCGDLAGVQPPPYLPRPPALQARSMASLAEDGPVNPDQIKRLTRAGMGPCQGRRCRDAVALTLARLNAQALGAVPLASFRSPVRPLPLGVLADWDEPAAMGQNWDVWFGIPGQWMPYKDIGTDREAEHHAALGGNMHL